MDLTQTFPRSPNETLSGLAHIPRMIDKARAAQSQTLGDYIYPCPLDEIILNFLQLDGDTFQQKANLWDDPRLSDWIDDLCRDRSLKEKKQINDTVLGRKPDTEESREKFYKIRDKIDATRSDVSTWVDLINLEEGRF